MLHLSDEAYTETRRVLAGVAATAPPYKALTEWIAQQPGGANVINVVYSMWAGTRPCLTVVMERDADVLSFAGEEPGSREVHERIVRRFSEISEEQRNTKVVCDNIFVILTAFAPAVRIEANRKVHPEAIFAFQHELAEPSIWLIKPHFENLRVFFHTDAALAASEHSGIRKRIAQGYRAVIAPYDEFGYVQEKPIVPVFDSRERFERVYKGNWQGYDRDK